MNRRAPRPKSQDVLRYRRVGVSLRRFADVYHFLMRASWWTILGITFFGYLGACAVFAWLFLLDPDGVSGMRATFADAFWFSVQTMSTIGYGAMSPQSAWAHAMVTLESFVGLAAVAVGTGLIFAKFSRPTARVAFSSGMVVYRRDGVPCLMFRMANERSNQIVEARLTVNALIEEVTIEGERMRRLRTLELERDTSPMFTLTWTAIHPLDARSPLMDLPRGPVDERVRAYIVSVTGTDDTFSQVVHARRVYQPGDVRVGFRFRDMLTDLDDGRVQIDHALISDVVPCSDQEAQGLERLTLGGPPG